MSTDYQIINEIKVDNVFFDFIDKEVCNGLDISAKDFFQSLSTILSEHQEKNKNLLKIREELQSKITKNSLKISVILLLILVNLA
jgi:malate synthase